MWVLLCGWRGAWTGVRFIVSTSVARLRRPSKFIRVLLKSLALVAPSDGVWTPLARV